LVEYKTDAHKMFQQLWGTIESDIANTVLKIALKPQASMPQQTFVSRTARETTSGKTPGRNGPCPCGAKHPDGRPMKYKHCCGKNA